MSRTALLIVCVSMVLLGSLSSAQQVSDWHPDRSAVSLVRWDDLQSVLVGSIQDYGDNYQAGNQKDDPRLSIHAEYSVTSPSSCLLQELSFSYQKGLSYQVLEVIDFRRIDPSSVIVQWNKDRSLYVVVFKSLPGQNFGDTTTYTRHAELPEAELFPVVSRRILGQFACAAGEVSCSKDVKGGEENYEFFVNVEIAHRFATASMQAALSCGEKK